jgi:putative transposase
MIEHGSNSGIGSSEAVFHKRGDCDDFIEPMIDVCVCVPVDVLGYCLMPNHLT